VLVWNFSLVNKSNFIGRL